MGSRDRAFESPHSDQKPLKSVDFRGFFFVYCGALYAESAEHIVTKLARFHLHQWQWPHGALAGQSGTDEGRFSPIDIKFTDRLAYYNAFDAYHAKHDLSAMEKLFAGYINERLNWYLSMLQEK